MNAFKAALPSALVAPIREVKDRIFASLRGITVEKLPDGAYVVSQDGKKAIVARKAEMRALIYRGGIAHLFNKPPFETGDSLIDFRKPLRFLSYEVFTNPSSVEENFIFEGYLLHYSPGIGDVVLDCGAFYGLFSIYISEKVGKTGKIFCFEPDPETVRILRMNIMRNGISNVEVVEKALWSKSGKLAFDADGNGASKVEFQPGNGSGGLEVDAVSIADFAAEKNLKQIDFVKMDIEGAELEVVRESKDFFKSHPANFAIASYHIRDGKMTCWELERIFALNGYRSQTEYPQHRTTYAAPSKQN